MRNVAERFGVSKSTVHTCVHQICKILSELSPRFIIWPKDAAHIDKIQAEFFEKAHFPGVIGTIDGCHVEIVCSDKSFQKAYFNRKGHHSKLVQGVCDTSKIFTKVYMGYPGSCHDARVLANSSLGYDLASNSNLVPSGKHIVGDSAYPLYEQLMVPYRVASSLISYQANFPDCNRACLWVT